MASNLFHRVYYRAVRVIGGICTGAIFGMNTIPHLFPQKLLTATKQVSCNSFEVREEHKKLLKETCMLMNIDSSNVQLFYTNGFSTHSAGWFDLPRKSIIGLPRNASFTNFNDAKNVNIKFEDKAIDWDSNIGKAMLDVLILKDEEVKFLIGHELTHIKNKDFLITTAHATGCFYGFYKAGVYLPSLFKGVPFRMNVLMNLFVWLLGIQVYFRTKESISHNFEFTADNESARLGKEYCRGGIEYMRNRLKLNRILRKLHGDAGEEMFSKVGDDLQNTLTHPKRTARLKKLKEIMTEYVCANGNPSVT